MSEDLIPLLRIRRSDNDLWAALYKKMWPEVYFSVYHRLSGDRSMAQEVTHDAFVRFFRYANLDTIENERHALAYLRQTARHLCWDRLRVHRNTVSLESKEGRQALSFWTTNEEDQQGLRSDLEHLAKSLSTAERNLLAALLTGHDTQEIAQLLNISYGTAAARISRLRHKLVSKSTP
jgi:RNA polymerase sigma factor (sigma-70 family)